MVKMIESAGEFASEIKGPGLVVVDFFAEWCGPCKMIAPKLEELSKKYPNVKFLKVDVEKVEEVAQEKGISAMPTFQFYVKGTQVDEMKGADVAMLESKIQQHQVDANPFGSSKGFTLGASSGGDADAPPMDPRAARLLKYGAGPPPAAPKSESVPMSVVDDEETAIAKAIAMSMTTANPSTASSAMEVDSKPSSGSGSNAAAALKKVTTGMEQDAADMAEAEAAMEAEDKAANDAIWGEEMVPVPVNEELLAEMLSMGFSDTRARKGLVNGSTVEGAINWIEQNENDPDIDQPYMVRKADTMPKKVLSAEEKAQRLEEMKAKIQHRREEKSRIEKAAAIKSEKDRRERGQVLQETQEERDRLARKREAEKQKKEKEAAVKERERLRAEIARDKELRKANKGVLPSVLGVDGYNPSIIQYDQPAGGGATGAPEVTSSSSSAPAPAATESNKSTTKAVASAPAAPAAPAKRSNTNSSAPSNLSVEQTIDASIQAIANHRTANQGGQALKLLLTFVKNVVDSPTDTKFRSINTESNAFKTKLLPIMGSVSLLKAVGFVKNESEGKFILEGDGQLLLLASVVAKLTLAEETYRQMNPV